MKLKLDENLGRTAAQPLRQAGHDVTTVHEQGMCAVADKLLIRKCTNESRCLVTLDMDFANPIVFDPKEYAGIAVLRLPANPSLDDILAAVRTLVAGLERANIHGKLWVIQRKRIREYNPDGP